jgi:predicted O-methyltransferase YrrM
MLHGVKQFARHWPVLGPVLTDRDRLRAEYFRLQAAHDQLLRQRDQLVAIQDDLVGQRDRLLAGHAQMQAQLERLNQSDWVPSGDYYSPIPSQKDMRAEEHIIWGDVPRTLPSVDLNEPGQLALFDELKRYYHELPFRDKPQPGLRFYFENDWFSYGDGTILYSMIRHLRPKRIIEIGSGYSSAVMLDTNDLFFQGTIACTFVEPNPERLLSLLRDGDQQHHQVIRKRIQDVELDRFRALEPGDILFVDSSHVSKVHSDVNWIFFQILPRLRPGVVIHFHDIFVGFEYPKEWVFQGRAWTEDYLLRAFLQYNRAFQVQFFNNYFGHSPRNRYVARALHEAGLATLLLDLLTAEEEEVDAITAHLRFDIDLLARRLIAAADWLGGNSETANLGIGCFGASTGAAAALIAAAERPTAVGAVVSRGGRPDLAGPALRRVQAPTLLIVGGNDDPVIDLNRQALRNTSI